MLQPKNRRSKHSFGFYLAFIELEFQISSFCYIGDEHVRESKGAVTSDAYQTS